MCKGKFVELESVLLTGLAYNNWRWDFMFKNVSKSEFSKDTGLVLKQYYIKMDTTISKVEVFESTWDYQKYCLCGLKFFSSGGDLLLEAGEFPIN